ncbi:hypothetical protein [Cupriavidus sp.]|uniref:hypothetical protein n=1 Tax=Cupriavidus sp. TaxID=1873897 RepID=UPI0031D043D5
MNHTQIDPEALKRVSEQIERDEWRDEIARQSADPWGHVALKVGVYLSALFIVIVVVHLISKWGTQ